MLIIREMDAERAWDYENGFYWFSHPSRINKALAHYEIYKKVAGLPGDIFEFGVYKGTSLLRFITFRSLLENESSRKIVGFDIFGKFPTTNITNDGDIEFIKRFENSGGDGLDKSELQAILNHKNFRNVELIGGNVFEALPAYLEKNPHVRLALLHLDMDVAEPTEFALKRMYDRIVPGGMIVVDDYNAVVGATEVIDKFIADKGLQLSKLPYYATPTLITKP
ncbi:TylF/MycF/NovP-related O-methyltransferase [Tistrella mobilis]|uniref:TylF/MycF/NovP-related O-methyltransferase n=1 Tax=Tistrella mobilis TaxID=171437 RepID=UPI0031F6CE3B